ncbi:glycosyltransferase family 4 protein [Natrialbaceae archaeon AArc-T1-2]|uniref:glycosyltransferase family 4 protein n=1 Tax=Natrialbaceae archaeon AArc-T1-2 TaxID=3053904 RepID=UPI00255B3D50|nr:glycosyltransferase family 4 protein [Natrialbaceae archaeon AArc-T1-2]WIV68833.1 glycosyltransferase family 4 protein [Natrialbaceae archaeon AArc-T1-2]
MKILRVASSLHPEKPGGVGLHVHQMSSMQAGMGHDVTILTSDNGDRSLPKYEERDGYSIIRHRQIVRPAGNSIIPGILNSLRKLIPKYDVVHAHSHLYFSSNMAALFGKFTDIPLAVTNHGLFSQTAPELLQKVFIPTVARPTLNTADRVFCYTDLAKQELRDRGVSAPVSVISNGIDCEMFKPDPEIEEKDQILFVGRLEQGKGPSYLIEAFNSVADNHPDLNLKIVGYGSLKADLIEQCKEHGIFDRVTFTGELSYSEMPQVYNESKILASPTLTEAAVPRVAMEAWACETPVVMSNIPEVSEEHVGDAASLVPLRDADALAQSIEKLIMDEELREQMGEKGRQRVLSNHSWQKTVERTTAQLKKICGEPKR